MSQPSNGITAEVIRNVMPPYHLSADLLQATFAALPPPPPDASSPWREARITRLTEEIVAPKPADAEQALRKAGLRTRRDELQQAAAVPGPGPGSTFPRVNLLISEPAAPPAPQPAPTFPRIDLLNSEPAATPAPQPASTLPRINLVKAEPRVASQPTPLAPTKAQAMRSTTLSETWWPARRAELARRFGPPPPPGWFVPQAWPPTASTTPASATPLSGGGNETTPTPRRATRATPPSVACIRHCHASPSRSGVVGPGPATAASTPRPTAHARKCNFPLCNFPHCDPPANRLYSFL